MSNSISAIQEPFKGYVTVSMDAPVGMLTLRGNLASKPFASAVGQCLSSELPSACQIIQNGDVSIGWMSPDELLISTPRNAVKALETGLRTSLAKKHFMLTDVSDARVRFTLSGPKVREVIAKLAPIDVAPDRFAPGTFRRTRFGQVSAAFWLVSDTQAQVICFRSVAEFMFKQLSIAAHPGSEVGLWG